MSYLDLRVGLLVAGVSVACAEPPPPAPSPPPPAVRRLPGAHVDGLPLRFSFELPPGPGHTLRLYAALSADTSGCSGGLPGLCLQLIRPMLLAETAVDTSGNTRVEVPWPSALAGVTSFYVQAVAGRPGGPRGASELWQDPVFASDDDSDHDGASAATEYAVGSRLDRADTDRGGVLDGQEIMAGTDPTDRADDRRVELSCDNGLDDDRDALLDCEDADCGVFCGETRCDDQLDDDGDGAVDCQDEECWTSNCLTHTLAWTVRGTASRGWYAGAARSSAHYEAHVSGRVRLYRGTETRTCTWQARARGEAALPPAVRQSSSVDWYRVFEAGDCPVGSEVLPPLNSQMWDGWYGPLAAWVRTEVFQPSFNDFIAEGGSAGPSFYEIPWPACAIGAPLVIAFPDADADGYGVSEASDMHDGLGGRHLFCGSPPPGFVEPGGDCDDRDPTWSPAAVTLAEGATCVDVESVDRDADGVTPPTDPDDQDGTRWGQERDCRDGTDDDHDGLLDCEDGDCADLPLCAESNCEDGLDGDRDGDVDCADEDCWQDETCTSVLAWVVTGQVEARFAPILGSILSAEDIQGRVRLGDPHGVRSCTWSVDAARRSSATGWYTWRTRHGFTITPGCDVGSSVLPDVPGIPQRHGRGSPRDWYYPLRPLGQQGPYLMYSGGPAFSSDPHGHCLPGETHVLGFPDTDGDGFGVSDPFDLHGALGGRRFACGSLPAGWVATGGDCDDTDRTWTPTRVRVRQGAACADLAPDDRDGDGVRAPADPNDNDATVP